ncbi:primosomal protein N' [Candidatus Babeliales bacterium]|nr:primosomal protein N' [Candidatus Babeliales bacterium]
MYVLVKLLNGFAKPLFYKIPENFNQNSHIKIGNILKVPIKNQFKSALILKIYKNLPESFAFKIKEFNNIQELPDDKLYYDFIKKISNFYFTPSSHFYKRINTFLLKENKKLKTETKEIKIIKSTNKKIILTPEQEKIVSYLQNFIEKPNYQATLIHGITGSGKTEIYKELIIKAIEQNKSIILLLPEVSLSLRFEFLLKKELPENIRIIGFHSASRQSAKQELWQILVKKEPVLVIGVHLPILLPISNLGLIIVDEEHEQNFQEKKHPKINSKELAIWRAQTYNIPIILGSATPSLSSIFNVKKNNWKYFKLNKRFSGNLPEIKVVLLNKDKQKKQKNFWISSELYANIQDRLNKREQTIIYINRRGYSFFVQCKKCGFIFQCPSCSVSLTLHNNKKQDSEYTLYCHYCDYKQNLPNTCPECKAESKNFLKKGIGTQQVVNIIKKLFPAARVERADLDSTSKKRAWQETVKKFERGEIDILIGTQLITKGYHFKKVTLVGILWADLNLNFPVYNASETTLQQLIQVAGRAGRANNKSCVIVQTMQDHKIFNYIHEQDYLEFCKQELEFRQLIQYPPFIRLVQIELKNDNTEQIEQDSYDLFQKLEDINSKHNLEIKILGPIKPAVYKIQKMESRQIFLKTNTFAPVHKLINQIDLTKFESKIYIVPTQ